jgi:hypothetical protein
MMKIELKKDRGILSKVFATLSIGVLAIVLFLKVPEILSHPNTSTVAIKTLRGTGTGVVIECRKVLTARHVIDYMDASDIHVITSDGKTNQVQDVFWLQNKDAAILTFKECLGAWVEDITYKAPKVGDVVDFIGVPCSGSYGLYRRGYVMNTAVSLPVLAPWDLHPIAYNNLTYVAVAGAHGDSGSGVKYKGKVFGILVVGHGNHGWFGVLPVSEFEELL